MNKTVKYILQIASYILAGIAGGWGGAQLANGLLMYVAQAFLLAGSIFGLDYYIKKIKDDFQS